MAKSIEDIREEIRTTKANFIDLQFTDLLGTLKSVVIVPGELDRAVERGYPFDGSSIEGFARIAESDMRLMPDLRTYRQLPFENDALTTARIVCDVVTPGGKSFEIDPRTVLKRAVEYASGLGFTFSVGPELEFFLLRKEIDEEDLGHELKNCDEKPAKGSAGPTKGSVSVDDRIRRYFLDNGGYFDALTNDPGSIVRKEIMLGMGKVGITPVMSHHEVAPSQHEIGIRYQDALKMADDVILYKHLVKSIAMKHGLKATFIPKLLSSENGSGMHVNLSLKRGKQNVFYSKTGRFHLSKTAEYFIGGLLKYISEIAALTDPIPPSYDRLVPGYEAPVYRSWADINRSALIRVPAIAPDEKNSSRIELRCPDPSCNPYLAFAAILYAGMYGVENSIRPPEPVGNKNLYKMSPEKRAELRIESLPGSLDEAVANLADSRFAKAVFGGRFIKTYVRVKKEEIKKQLPFKHYLNV